MRVCVCACACVKKRFDPWWNLTCYMESNKVYKVCVGGCVCVCMKGRTYPPAWGGCYTLYGNLINKLKWLECSGTEPMKSQSATDFCQAEKRLEKLWVVFWMCKTKKIRSSSMSNQSHIVYVLVCICVVLTASKVWPFLTKVAVLRESNSLITVSFMSQGHADSGNMFASFGIASGSIFACRWTK